MRSRIPCAGVVIAAVLAGAAPAQTQQPPFPLSPQDRGMAREGLPVIPLFEGFYKNPDGTYTFEFGYWNRNDDESFVIPIGEDNAIEPAQYNGGQPTVFPPSRARGYNHGNSTGNFTVTVPAEFVRGGGAVVWTIRSNGSVNSVPGEAAESYGLSLEPQAGGSLPPMLKLEADGPELWGSFTAEGDPRERTVRRGLGGGDVRGSYAHPVRMTANVGVPVALTVWAADRFVPLNERKEVKPGVTIFTHQGPAEAEVGPAEVDDDGKATAAATFPQPGRYLLLVRADNFTGSGDSSLGDHCCWTNGYVEVTVSR